MTPAEALRAALVTRSTRGGRFQEGAVMVHRRTIMGQEVLNFFCTIETLAECAREIGISRRLLNEEIRLGRVEASQGHILDLTVHNDFLGGRAWELPSKTPEKKPRKPRASARKVKQTDAELLCAELAKRTDSVIDGGVRVLGPNHFKCYKSTLLKAAIGLGGDPVQVDREFYRNEIEIVADEMAGYRGHCDPVLEFLVHSDLKLKQS